MKKIVTIGGGSGTFNLLVGLKKYDYDISAIVSMADSGGSNKIIRDEFGLLPTSDVRQSLAALADEKNSDSQNLLRELFLYRFEKGEGVKGMTFGNLFMAALADILGDQAEAIRKTGDILKIKGKVIPVTETKSDLTAIYENGLKVKGEHKIDEPKHDGKLKIEKIYLDPPVSANPEAVRAIENADLIIIGPGDLYTSLISNLAVDGIAEALKNTKAKIIYVLNLMTSFGETYGFAASDFKKVVENYMLGRSLDYLIVNSANLPKNILEKYKEENDFPVEDDLDDNNFPKIIRGDFLDSKEIKKKKADVLKRSLIRHDGDKIVEAISPLLRKGGAGGGSSGSGSREKIHNIKEQKQIRKNLRNNMTKTEIILWSKLKGKQLGYKFRRQHGIGKYIVDFYCPKLKLIIEVDGDVHAFENNIKKDQERQKFLESLNFKVKRYTNNDILKNLNGVLEDLIATMEAIDSL